MKIQRFFILCVALHLLALAYPDRILRRIPVGEAPFSSCLTQTGRYAYLLGATKILVVDALVAKEVRTITPLGIPQALACRGDTLYVTTDIEDRLYEYSIESRSSPVLKKTHVLSSTAQKFVQIVFLSDENLLALRTQQERIYIFNLSNEAFVTQGSASFIDPGASIADVAALDDGRFLILGKAGSLRVCSASGLSTIFSTTLGAGGSLFSRIFSDTSLSQDAAWVSRASSAGELWNAKPLLSSMTVVGPKDAGTKPSALLVSDVLRPIGDAPSGRYLFVGHQDDPSVDIFDATVPSGSVLDTLTSVGKIAKYGWSADEERGYVYASDGSTADWTVLSDQPSVDLRSVPTTLENDKDATLELRASRSGKISLVQMRTDEDVSLVPDSGTLLATRTVGANQYVQVSFPTDRFIEGKNLLAVYLESSDYLGRIGAEITKDTVPKAPSGFRLSFGNEKIFIHWNRSKEEDIDHYEIDFGSDTSFGGVAGLESPVEIDANETRYTLSPLPNGMKVRVRLSVFDRTGHQSPYTETLTETPERTVGLLSMSGEQGGCRAGKEGLGSFVLMLLGGALCVWSRRSF